MKKKIVSVADGKNSSIVTYEDGSKETMPDGVFMNFNPPKDEAKKDDDDTDYMGQYVKKLKGQD